MASKKHQRLLDMAGLKNQEGGKITPDALQARIARGGDENVVRFNSEKGARPPVEVTLQVCCRGERVVVL